LDNQLDTELGLIERALRAKHFRLLIVQYNHFSLITRIQEHLESAYPERELHVWDALQHSSKEIMKSLSETMQGFYLLIHTEELLSDKGFTQSLNQWRDRLSQQPFGLILLLPSGGEYVRQFARAMPDLWSIRNLVAELSISLKPAPKGANITQESFQINWNYPSFQNRQEALAEINRLKNRINELEKSEKATELLITLYNQLGSAFSYISDYHHAKQAFKKLKAIAQKTQNSQAEGVALAETGILLISEGKLAEAEKLLIESLQIQRRRMDQEGEAEVLHALSDIYFHRGKLEEALKFLNESLRLKQQAGNLQGTGATLNNISQVYFSKGDYKKTKEYLERSLDIAKANNDLLGESAALNNLGQLFKEEEDYQKAIRFLEKSLRLKEQLGDKNGMGATLNNLSQIFIKKGDYKEALKLLERSIDYQQSIGNSLGYAIGLHNMGCFYFEVQRQAERALPLFIEAYQIFSNIGSPHTKTTEKYLDLISKQIGKKRYLDIKETMNQG
jgi:tetratricopeptide (TPR) repeat protein